MKRLISIVALCLIAGCSVIATKDIDQAIGLATSANDGQGLACLNAQKLIFSVEPIGLFTVAEQARLMTSAIGVCASVLPSAAMVAPIVGQGGAK